MYGGIHWSGVSVVGMGESRGEFPPARPSHSIQLSPVWFNGGILGGWSGGWVVGGKVAETMYHVSITCIHHSTLTYPFLGESPCADLGKSPWGSSNGGTVGCFIGSVLPIGRVGPTHRNCLN